MATVGGAPQRPTPKQDEQHARQQLRKDRIQFAVIVVGVVALFAVLIWLTITSPVSQSIDYRPWIGH